MKISRPPVAQAGGLTDVYLKTDPGSGFTPADRIVGDSGNFRTVGPILGATSGDRVFKRIRIPLRPFAADSVAIGKTLFLVVIDTATGLVVERPTVKIAAGMTEAVFERPFIIPAGRQYAYAYGIEEGEWNSYLFLFYGHGSPYTTPYNTVLSLYSDGVPPQVGQGWNVPSQTGKHRPIICEADGVVKNVRGPLDPSDFPVVTSADKLIAGQTALLDNGTDPLRLIRKRLDGSVVSIDTPVAAPSGGGSAGPVVFGYSGKRVTQTLAQSAWTRVSFYTSAPDRAGGAMADSTFTCTAAGVYLIGVTLEIYNGGSGTAYFNGVVRKNTADAITITSEYFGSNLPATRSVSTPIRLAVGETLEVWVLTDRTDFRISAPALSDPPSFTVLRLGE